MSLTIILEKEVKKTLKQNKIYIPLLLNNIIEKVFSKYKYIKLIDLIIKLIFGLKLIK